MAILLGMMARELAHPAENARFVWDATARSLAIAPGQAGMLLDRAATRRAIESAWRDREPAAMVHVHSVPPALRTASLAPLLDDARSLVVQAIANGASPEEAVAALRVSRTFCQVWIDTSSLRARA
ncbi:MAG: hypothetical protein ACR2J8_07830 [Thermomicrobiales bacterium]